MWQVLPQEWVCVLPVYACVLSITEAQTRKELILVDYAF